PWYYMHITADTQDPDTVYAQNYGFWKSIDGGASFQRIPTPHGDDHALWIDPRNNQRMIEGNDGGACVSFDGGWSWSSIYNQPTAQLYHVTTDDQVPYRVYGSQQDNSAISLPSRTVDGAITERDWYAPGGGESGYIAVKPDDPNIVVASGPAGRRAYNDIMTLYDHRTGQKWNNTVWPELYGWGVGAEGLKYRFQWTFPIHFSQHDPDVLYVCSQHVHRSTTLGANWEVVSPDLTRHEPETLVSSGGPLTRDNTGAEVYATIFAFAESPHERGVFWAGSDDGLISLTRDDCRSWQEITPPESVLPARSQVLIIAPSPHDKATCYVAATRYKIDDRRPYLLKTSDYGQSWTAINGDLPEECITRVVREDPEVEGLLFLGTETGLSVSFDDGQSWRALGGNIPVVPVHDLVVKGDELVVATHGRSFWILDDLVPLREMRRTPSADAVHLFPPRPRLRMRDYGGRLRDGGIPGSVNYSHADTSLIAILPERRPDGSIRQLHLDAGQNPPQGTVVQYYVPRTPESEVTLEVLEPGGAVLRRFDSAPAEPGVNRVLWNWRLAGAPSVEGVDLQPWDRPDGPMVLPGDYRVRLSVDGQTVSQPVVIEPDPRVRTSRADLQAQYDFLREILDELTLTNRTINQIGALLGQLAAWRERVGDRDGLVEQIEALAAELHGIRGALIDVNMRGAQLWPSGLHEKLSAVFDSVDSADYAPPRQAREAVAQFADQLEGLASQLRTLLRQRIPALN
ncbi:MAG TPA: glycosyl hydrolase, partial [Thermomicrobiaceae bacterium]|nr:glycosyl hydrolase [Thermomicrobiaceae bacterium]